MRSSLAQIFAIVPGQQLAYGFTSGIYGCQRTGNTDEVRENNTHKAEWTLVWLSREGEGREKGQGLRPGRSCIVLRRERSVWHQRDAGGAVHVNMEKHLIKCGGKPALLRDSIEEAPSR